jgi:hypothetical protein
LGIIAKKLTALSEDWLVSKYKQHSVMMLAFKAECEKTRVANLTGKKKVDHDKKVAKINAAKLRLGSKYKERVTKDRSKVLSIGAMGKRYRNLLLNIPSLKQSETEIFSESDPNNSTNLEISTFFVNDNINDDDNDNDDDNNNDEDDNNDDDNNNDNNNINDEDRDLGSDDEDN